MQTHTLATKVLERFNGMDDKTFGFEADKNGGDPVLDAVVLETLVPSPSVVSFS
jgi:hypothetical protein